MRQAERDLVAAGANAAAGLHERACFAAQQAAEMAVKAWHQSLGQKVRGHVIRRLLERVPTTVAAAPELFEAGQQRFNVGVR